VKSLKSLWIWERKKWDQDSYWIHCRKQIQLVLTI
jgi:hypothetical protein